MALKRYKATFAIFDCIYKDIFARDLEICCTIEVQYSCNFLLRSNNYSILLLLSIFLILDFIKNKLIYFVFGLSLKLSNIFLYKKSKDCCSNITKIQKIFRDTCNQNKVNLQDYIISNSSKYSFIDIELDKVLTKYIVLKIEKLTYINCEIKLFCALSFVFVAKNIKISLILS